MPWQHQQPVTSELRARNKGICESYLSVGPLRLEIWPMLPVWKCTGTSVLLHNRATELLLVLFSNLFLEISQNHTLQMCWVHINVHINVQWDSILGCWSYWPTSQLQGKDINCKAKKKLKEKTKINCSFPITLGWEWTEDVFEGVVFKGEWLFQVEAEKYHELGQEKSTKHEPQMCLSPSFGSLNWIL